MPLIKDVYQELLSSIENTSVEKSSFDILFQNFLNFENQVEVELHAFDEMPDYKLLKKQLNRLLIGEPVQYIINKGYFYGNEFYVDNRVLIPRMETEELIDLCLHHTKGLESPVVYDICTGSGCLGITFKMKNENALVYLSDISKDALSVAKKNAEKYHVQNISFRKSDLFSAIDESEKFNVVAANLPYVTFAEYEKLDRQVRDWEPELALTADDDGLLLINRLCDNLERLLTPDGFAVLEMSPHQTAKVKERLEKLNFNAKTVDDYTGRARFVCAKKK